MKKIYILKDKRLVERVGAGDGKGFSKIDFFFFLKKKL
jgi:hypothetical protein